MTTYKVTKDKLFYDKVVEIDINDLVFQQNGFNGTMGIETESGWKYISGHHGAEDYVEDYGFRLVKEY